MKTEIRRLQCRSHNVPLVRRASDDGSYDNNQFDNTHCIPKETGSPRRSSDSRMERWRRMPQAQPSVLDITGIADLSVVAFRLPQLWI